MTADDLIRKLRKAARRRGVAFEVDTRRGKGAHVWITFGGRSTTLPRHPGRDLPRGTFRAILRQLAVDEDEI